MLDYKDIHYNNHMVFTLKNTHSKTKYNPKYLLLLLQYLKFHLHININLIILLYLENPINCLCLSLVFINKF